MDTDKYEACPKHTHNECRNRTSANHATHCRQQKYNKNKRIHNTNLHGEWRCDCKS